MRRALLLTLGGVFLASAAHADITNVRFALHRKAPFTASKEIPSLCDNKNTTTVVENNYSPIADGIDCSEYTVTGPAGAGSQLYVVLAGFDAGIGGVSFGIDYEGRAGTATGVDPTFVSWEMCSGGLEYTNDGGFGEFPAPKGGIRLTWTLPDGCTRDEVNGIAHAICGSIYVYAYSEDVVRLTPNNNLISTIPELAITNCGGATTDLAVFLTELGIDPHDICGRVHLGGDGSQGYCSCCIVPAAPTTWGKLKTLYSH